MLDLSNLEAIIKSKQDFWLQQTTRIRSFLLPRSSKKGDLWMESICRRHRVATNRQGLEKPQIQRKGTHRSEPNITFPSRHRTIHKPSLKTEKLSREYFRQSHGTEENTEPLRPRIHNKHPGLSWGFLMDCIPK